MSKLKSKLREILPLIAAEANRCHDRELKERYYLIKAIALSKKSVVRACADAGRSTDWFSKWARRLINLRSLDSLKARSKTPKHFANRTLRRIEKRILALRKAEPFAGQERISFDLKRLFNMRCSPSTVYAVLRRLNLITETTKRQLTKRHIKRYRRPLPGYCQMDVKYVPQKVEGKQLYEFNFVDHCTTWRLVRIYPNLTHECVEQFMREIELYCPFPIFELQTDNGSEFTDKYRGGRLQPSGLHVVDLWCQRLGIKHRLIPVGQKELNGKVENTHKQDDREFYSQQNLRSLSHARHLMASYNERWNSLRHTKALSWKTPEQALEAACVRVIAWISVFMENHRPLSKINTLIQWDAELNASISAPIVATRKRPSTRKKPTQVDRYLEYQEWSRKKSS